MREGYHDGQPGHNRFVRIVSNCTRMLVRPAPSARAYAGQGGFLRRPGQGCVCGTAPAARHGHGAASQGQQ